jgi:Txe/YoeB family toxin of Txe-Axe toxin-antitoxin module
MKKKLIKFILSFTDYDRLKNENEKLKSDINTLIEHPNSFESFLIIESFETEKILSKMLWFGNPIDLKDKFTGIINAIAP